MVVPCWLMVLPMSKVTGNVEFRNNDVGDIVSEQQRKVLFGLDRKLSHGIDTNTGGVMGNSEANVSGYLGTVSY